jgi:hypothetical protein
MDRLLLLPFLLAGVLIVVFHRRLAAAFQASHRSFYETLLGKERSDRLGGAPGGRRDRFDRAYTPTFVIFFGLAWIAICVYALVSGGS